MPHAHRTRHDAVEPGRTVSDAAMRDRLIVALDVATVAEAEKVVRDLGEAGYAIGFIVFVFLTLLSLTMTWILKYSGEPAQAPAPSTQPVESLAEPLI